MRDGKLVGELSHNDASEAAILELAAQRVAVDAAMEVA